MKKKIKNILKDKSDSILFAYFFGSHAQGTASKNSDIDIAVFLKDSVYESFFDIKMDLYLNLSRTLKRNDIDLVIMNTCKNLIILNNIISHGFVIYCQDESFRLDYEQKIMHSAIDFKHQRYMAMGI